MKSRFLLLSPDVLSLLFRYLSMKDALSLVNSDEELAAKYKQSNLLEKRTRDIVARINPHSELISNFTDNALLVERGFSTVYHVWSRHIANDTFDTGKEKKAIFGTPFGLTENKIIFSVPGLPMKKGTIVHLLLDTDIVSYCIDTYFSLEEIWDEMLKSNTERKYIMDSFLEMLYDEKYPQYSELVYSPNEEEIRQLYHLGLDKLIKTGKFDDYRYLKIRLP